MATALTPLSLLRGAGGEVLDCSLRSQWWKNRIFRSP